MHGEQDEAVVEQRRSPAVHRMNVDEGDDSQTVGLVTDEGD